MEIKETEDNIIIDMRMDWPDEWDEDYKYITQARFEEDDDGNWIKTEEFDLQILL